MNAAALFHRALVAISGQPDAWATPMNHAAGKQDVDTREAWKFAGCAGNCNQGRTACDCEMACDIAPDADRIIQPPIYTPEDAAYTARIRRMAVMFAVMGFAFLASLLGIADARWQP